MGQHSAQRRAALAVHAMLPADRECVLRELPGPQRDLLQGLLVELADLGIPQDARLLRGAMIAPPDVPAARVECVEETALSSRSTRSLVRWLRCEPPQVAARLLNACPDWRVRLLCAFPRPEQRSLVSLAASLPPAPELDRLVLAAARRHLRSNGLRWPMTWLRNLAAPVTRGEQR